MITTIDIERAQAELEKMLDEYAKQKRANSPIEFAFWAAARALEQADVVEQIATEHDRIVKLHRQRVIDAVVSAGGTVTIDDAGEVRMQLPSAPAGINADRDFDAAAERYAKRLIRHSKFKDDPDTVVFDVPFSGLLWLVAPLVDGPTTEHVLRIMLARCLSDFCRQQTGGDK